jgi:NTE family protein
MKALVLSGGGARGAYQVGVLSAVAELAESLKQKSPFKIYTGISAGAINASFCAAGADDLHLTTKNLIQLWSSLSSDQIFKTDAVSLGKIGLKWMGELSLGALSGAEANRSLLDTEPLSELIRNNCEFSKIDKHIENGFLHSLAITALDYKSSTTITFVQGHEDVNLWQRSRRIAELTEIKTEHVMASSAIPILFPPAQIGERYFGDGCIRNLAPVSPAIHLGAQKILVVGVRKQSTTAYELKASLRPPSVARVVNVLLNSVLLDGVEVDIERLERINEFIRRVPDTHHDQLNFKTMDYVFINPSEDIGQIAAELSSRLPRVIRYLLKGLGPLEDASEIMSYLMFENDFTSRLIEIGYEDGMRSKDAILKFLAED